MLVSFQWIGPITAVAVSMIMFALGLILEREQITAALHRRVGLGR
jgi:predicted Na+-dependent transporter